MTELFDAAVIGAGPAGLTAATYLGRFRRRVVVLDAGRSRARWIPESHNTPGFDRGISGPTLLQRMRAQAASYGADIRPEGAEGLDRVDGVFRISVAGEGLEVPFVVLANGIEDVLPPLPGLEAALCDSRARLCPICDAYEAIDQPLAVLGNGDLGGREALFLRHYSAEVTLLVPSGANPPSPDLLGRLGRARVACLRTKLTDLKLVEDGWEFAQSEGEPLLFNHLYLALGCRPAREPLIPPKLARDQQGMIQVDAHQRTSLDGLYAAGDIVRGLNQITVAAAEGAIAATDIHKRLREEDA